MNRTALLFAALSLVFAGLFGADLLGYFNRAQNPVAVLGASRGNIKRLGKDQLTWDRAAGGTLFGGGDTIATGEDSRAKLEIFAGGELELDAGSMVVLGGDLHELKLNFLSGGGKVRITKAAKGKIAVERKTASVVKKAARASKFATNSKPDAPEPAPPSNVQVEEVEASELSAAAPASSSSSPASASASAAAPKLAEAPDPPPLAVPAIQEKSMRNPQQGLVAGKGELISLQALPPIPVVSSPADDAVISLRGGAVPKLAWSVEQKPEAQGRAQTPLTYEIVFRPAQGDGPEKILRSDKPSVPLDRLTQGKYRWSVRAINAEGKRGPASVARALEVKIPEQISKPLILPVHVE